MNNSNDSSLASCLILLIYVPVLVVISSLIDGWALVKLWSWFVIPLFESAPQLTLLQAIGISLIVSFLTHQSDLGNNENKATRELIDSLVQATTYVIVRPLFIVLIGYVITLFM